MEFESIEKLQMVYETLKNFETAIGIYQTTIPT